MKKRILIVRSEADTRTTITNTLEAAGYQITLAPDGVAALDMLSMQRFDVIVSDVLTATVNAFGLLEAAAALLPAPAVIVLATYHQLDQALAALRLGAAEYLIEPCDQAYLRDAVSAALKRANTAPRPATLPLPERAIAA